MNPHPRVAYQGVAGAFSEQASLQYSPHAEATGYHSFAEAFEAALRGECDYACLPVENSLAGSINQTYDLLNRLGSARGGRANRAGASQPDGPARREV